MFAASKTASVSGGYQISRSLRFNSADSTTLSRNFATNGTSRTTSTISFWTKLTSMSTSQSRLIDCYDGSSADSSGIYYENNVFTVKFGGSGSTQLTTTAVYRDPSAWYHLCAVFDSTQATSTNRIKFYVNGVQVTTFSSSSYPNQNATYAYMSSGVRNYIGDGWNAPTTYLVNLYLAEFFYIDGQALTPSSFGNTDAQTGVWGPKAYSGSFGTNGFYLNFSDNSNTTAATLGKDYSGNGNNWTPNNFSVTAGAGNDSLVDSPTSYGVDTGAGGTVRGNYSTLNPLQNGMTNAPRNGNLEIAGSAEVNRSIFNTIGVTSGKWYFEVVITTGTGVTNVAWSSNTDINKYAGEASTSYGYELENGNKIVGGGVTAYGSALTTNDVFMCCADMDNLKLFFGKNGTFFASSNPVTGANSAYTFAAGTYFFQMRPYTTSSSVVTTNFGQRPFAYTAPSGFKALNTQNLPTPTIGATTATQAGKFFNPVLYTGTGSDNRAVTGVGFQPDFVWVKGRDIGQSHVLNNAVAGVGTAKTLYSNLTVSQGTYDDYGYLQSLDADGYTIKNGSINGNLVNASGYQYVAWNWKANGSGSSNTAGSITSTVSANTTSGFSIVTYNGTGANATVGHGLGVAPSVVIVKSRSNVLDWSVGHISIGFDKFLVLNTTAATTTASSVWQNTAPSSTVFTIGNAGGVNTSSATYVAYCFAPVAGYSAFGSYTGNGSADGPFVFTGFRPAFVLIKFATGITNWLILDDKRDTYNVERNKLYPNVSDAEDTSAENAIDFVSNGFKIRTGNNKTNDPGATMIYAAFASTPQKFSLAR